jgi:hypothetical protein
LPKIRLEPERRRKYEKAVERARRAGDQDITLTSWIRRTLDREAERQGQV